MATREELGITTTPPLNIETNQSRGSRQFYQELETYYQSNPASNVEKLQNFTKYVSCGDIGRFLCRSKIFEQVLSVPGWIIDCGVFMGAGLMTWAHLSAILEPLNHVRRIVGMDTFAGFPDISDEDKLTEEALAKPFGLKADSYADLTEAIRLYDLYRPLGHIARVQLVRGNAVDTIPKFIEATPHLVVALLYLDFDLFEPTKVAIEQFLPYMPKGSILAFDELNNGFWPGETVAVQKTIGLRNLRLRRFPFQPQISYAVLE
jgi:hypothetical protein